MRCGIIVPSFKEELRMPKRRNRPNPDDRRDNVEHLQKNIDTTIRNMEAADEMIAKTSDGKAKEELKEKNERRKQSLDGFRREIRDEARAREGKHNNE
jgi:small acid-soluble spore protein (thioredoxin-like protein)